MADGKKGEDPTPKSGQLIRGGASGPPAPRAKHRTIDRLLNMLSIWPFRNRSFLKSLETAQEVIDKQNKLEDTVIKHAHTRGRLNDLEITLAQDHLQRQREFIEERSRVSNVLNDSMLEQELVEKKNKLKKGDVEIEEMEQQKKRLKLERKLRDLSPPPPAPEPSKKKRVTDPIYSKVKAGIKQAKVEERSTKVIDESGLSEEKKKNLRKELRIAAETQKEEK